jgi:nitrogen regulatory protein PII
MKMMLAVYSEIVDDDVMSALAEADIGKYTKMERVIGRSPDSEEKLAKLGTLYWPEKYTLLMIAAQDEEVSKITDMFRQLK